VYLFDFKGLRTGNYLLNCC